METKDIIKAGRQAAAWHDASAPRPTIRPKFRKFSAVVQRQKK